MLKSPWLLLLLVHFVLSQTTDKYSDEDRPYKFGFNIQGYQHRQEEKDERGLIKGEYGFITADGYYRVTVYATDENGDFKILSMKNYYVGFPPEDPTTTPGPSGIGMGEKLNLTFRNQAGPASGGVKTPVPSFGRQAEPAAGAKENGRNGKSFVRPQGLAACSDCSIPTTTTRTNQFGGGAVGGGFGTGRGSPAAGASPQFQPGTGFRGPSGGQGRPGTAFGEQGTGGRGLGQQSPTDRNFGAQGTPGSSQGFGGQSPQFPAATPQGIQPRTGGFGGSSPTGPGSAFGGVNQQGGRAGGVGSPNFPSGRNDFAQNNQLGDGPGRRPQVGEVRDGLPPGVSVKDIKDLLYTFNYTVGFHGHHEDGYRNGDKEGDYFFDGRDGVERKVEYLANEFGYQPNITLIDLPDNDVRKPKEETEKEYGLKGYEFKWFYRK